MRKARTRIGFTLVEVIFAALVTAGLVGICYQIFAGQHRTAYKLDAKYEALNSALVAAESLQKDLSQIVSLPLQIKDDGTSERRWGDHTAPVKVAWSGRSVAFYVPEAKARPDAATPDEVGPEEAASVVTYALVPAPMDELSKQVLYNVKRINGKVESQEEALAAEGRILGKVTVRDLRFRLLDPKEKDPDKRSPDENYYLETVIEGADHTGVETRTLQLVTHLAFPTEMQKSVTLHPQIEYACADPLVTPADTFRLSPQEKQTLDDLNKAADDFRNGKMPAKQLEDKIKEIINRNAGQPGRGPVFDNTGRFIPRVDRLTLVNPDSKGPLVLTDGDKTNVVIPPPPASAAPTGPAAPPVISMTPRQNNLTITGGMAHYTERPAGSGNWVLVNSSNININLKDGTSGQVDSAFNTANQWADQNGVGQWVKFDRSQVDL